MKRNVGLLLAAMLLLALIPAVLAGGWAVVSLDEPPGEIHAGEPWRVDFTVLQHGQTPVHDLDATSPVEPLLIAENPATGQCLEIMAERMKEAGRFTIEVTFPSDGTWEWTILPNPLLGETVFEPLTVLPAANAAAVKEVKPAAEPAVAVPAVTQPEVAQPAAPAPTTTVDAGFSWQAGLRWAALALGLVALALFLLQGWKRSSAQARVES